MITVTNCIIDIKHQVVLPSSASIFNPLTNAIKVANIKIETMIPNFPKNNGGINKKKK